VAVQRDNPYLNFNFTVDIGVGDELGFSEVDGLSGEIEVIEYREGADRVNTARKLPGLAKYPNVMLKRGITGRTDLFEWWKSVRDGQVQRRDVTITLLDEQRQPVLRWLLRNAFPVKIEGPELNATGNEVAIETLELAHEGLEID
jgi:phage tail-like protein